MNIYTLGSITDHLPSNFVVSIVKLKVLEKFVSIKPIFPDFDFPNIKIQNSTSYVNFDITCTLDTCFPICLEIFCLCTFCTIILIYDNDLFKIWKFNYTARGQREQILYLNRIENGRSLLGSELLYDWLITQSLTHYVIGSKNITCGSRPT